MHDGICFRYTPEFCQFAPKWKDRIAVFRISFQGVMMLVFGKFYGEFVLGGGMTSKTRQVFHGFPHEVEDMSLKK